MTPADTSTPLEIEAIRLVGWVMALRPDLAERVPVSEMRRMAAETILQGRWQGRPVEDR